MCIVLRFIWRWSLCFVMLRKGYVQRCWDIMWRHIGLETWLVRVFLLGWAWVTDVSSSMMCGVLLWRWYLFIQVFSRFHYRKLVRLCNMGSWVQERWVWDLGWCRPLSTKDQRDVLDLQESFITRHLFTLTCCCWLLEHKLTDLLLNSNAGLFCAYTH